MSRKQDHTGTPSAPPYIPAPHEPVTGPVGWTCPRCGRGNAQNNPTCPCLPPPVTITC